MKAPQWKSAERSSKSRRSNTYGSNISGLSILEMNLSKITEAEFREYMRVGAIRSATVVKAAEGYVLVVELTWKEGMHTLYTIRNHPRAWVSLDRMVSYLERNNLKLTSLSVQWNK